MVWVHLHPSFKKCPTDLLTEDVMEEFSLRFFFLDHSSLCKVDKLIDTVQQNFSSRERSLDWNQDWATISNVTFDNFFIFSNLSLIYLKKEEQLNMVLPHNIVCEFIVFFFCGT